MAKIHIRWFKLVRGRLAHAVYGDGLDTLCGLSPEIAEPPKDLPHCPKCERILRGLRQA